jgi:prevent-host-death family protein
MPNQEARRQEERGHHVMKEVALSEVKDDLSRYLRQTAKEEIVITRHGKAAGVLIGFASEDDWFDYRLENDPRFLERIAAARANLRAGRGCGSRMSPTRAAGSAARARPGMGAAASCGEGSVPLGPAPTGRWTALRFRSAGSSWAPGRGRP